MNSFSLDGVICYELVFCRLLFLGGNVLPVYLRNLGSYIRKHEELRIAYQGGNVLVAFVGHLNRLLLLIDDEIQRIGDNMHLLVLVLHVEVVGLLQKLLHALL